MLFPFITGKNFTFRIIVEIIFALWVGLAILRPEFRPRLTPLFKAVTIFIAILFLADLFSPNPYRAFFSNYERMEGFMMLFHLYLYFVMLVSVFKKRDWLIFFHVTLVASVLVSYVALLQKLGYRPSLQGGFRVDSTIGNPTYLAAYLMFHVWMSLLLIYQFWKKRWPVAFYGAVLIFELVIIYFTATRGAVIALVGTSILISAALIFFWRRAFPAVSHWRPLAIALFLFFLTIPAIFWSIRETSFVKSSQVLTRITNYSLEERTIQSRFKIWGMSARGVLERPILGWGQENYYLVFQKYFHPGLYAQEPWFDRSHNIIFDWAIHAGILGLLSFLSILGIALWEIFDAMRKSLVPVWHWLILSALFAAYFFQNIFVFDNLNTYLLLFAFLAYTDFLRYGSEAREAGVPIGSPASKNERRIQAENYRRLSGRAYAFTAMLLAAVAVGGYFLHVKPILESKALIRALQLTQVKGTTPAKFKEAFEKALSYNTFGDTEVREQLGNLLHSVVSNNSFPQEERKEFFNFAVSELRKETERQAKDVKHLIFLGSILARGGIFDPTNLGEAERILKEAIKLSPTKQIAYFELAQFYLTTGNVEQALEVLEQAWNLDRSYQEAGANVLLVALLFGKTEVAEKVRDEINFNLLPIEVLERLGGIYRQKGDFSSALKIYDVMIKSYPANAQYRLVRGALLMSLGRNDEAKAELKEALRLNPELKDAKSLLESIP
jgi:tetratricopeptide (TPR) repeat protein